MSFPSLNLGFFAILTSLNEDVTELMDDWPAFGVFSRAAWNQFVDCLFSSHVSAV